MTYSVTFRKRFNADGEASENPALFVQAAEGVVIEAAVAKENEPPAQHSQDDLDEDDNFESIGTEVWEYEIAGNREDEFLTALKKSEMVIDYEKIDDVV